MTLPDDRSVRDYPTCGLLLIASLHDHISRGKGAKIRILTLDSIDSNASLVLEGQNGWSKIWLFDPPGRRAAAPKVD